MSSSDDLIVQQNGFKIVLRTQNDWWSKSPKVGGWNKIKFLNFKFSMHMGVPWVCRNTFYFIGTPLFFKFCPYLGQKTSLQTVQKTKRGPLGGKIAFFTICL